jgi:thiol-disulfide isomerase/thioredoxin
MTAKVLRSTLILALVLSTASLALLLASLWRGEPAKPPVVARGAPQDAALGEFTPLDPPRPAPPLAFAERDGDTRQLGDFRGHWLLVNLWATWCAPCVREMPSLDRLQAKLGNQIRVLALSEDRKGAEVVDPFLGKLDLKAMTIYLDPAAHAQQAFGIRGLPTSFLIDPEGVLRGKLEGAAEWDSPKMLALIEQYLAQGPAEKKAAAAH